MVLTRLEVWDPRGMSHLRTARGLPAMTVQGGVKAPLSKLVEAARKQLGIAAAFVTSSDDGTVVMESLDPDVALPPGLRWESGPPRPAADNAPPWFQPGWFGRTLPMIDDELEAHGRHRTGPMVQVRHIELAALLRIPTVTGDVWFKEVPPVFSHEGAVTAWLAQLVPQAVPDVIASGPGWWIAAEFPAEAEDPQGHAFETLVKIQLDAAPRTSELLEIGCPYRGLDQLVEDVAALVERDDLVPPRDADGLRAALPAVEKIFVDVEALGIPHTVVHGDFRNENVRWTDDGWFLYDWSDACIAHPFVDVEDRDLGSWDDETQIFSAKWSEAVAPQSVERTQAVADVICAAHRCITFQRITDSSPEFMRGSQILLFAIADLMEKVERRRTTRRRRRLLPSLRS
jgi:hypothetical protein